MAAPKSLRHRACGIALALALAPASACSLVGGRTAYCRPEDPVVTPQVAAPGEELRVEVPGNVDGVGCEPDLPDAATYQIWVTSEAPAADPADGRYRAPLGSLEPDEHGDAAGTIRLPDDMPAGQAEVSVRLHGAPTVCDLDPSIGCAPDPSARLEVTD